MPEVPDSLVVTTDTGDRIHYLDWGEPQTDSAYASGPPLLLVHGLASTAWIWAPIANRLRTTTQVLALDLRGHGLSDSPRSGYDLESLAFDALTVLAANGWGHEVGGAAAVVAGHGLGAMVAATMATLQPESVVGIALIDGGWEEVGEATRMTAHEFEASVGDPPEVLASMAAYLADRREFDPATWDADQERAARAAVDEKHAGHVAPVLRRHALHATVEAMFSYKPMATLLAVDVPIHVAVAESGTGEDESGAERLVALEEIVRAQASRGLPVPIVTRYTGVGHNLMRYRPAALAEDLQQLLREAVAHQRS